ncbi:hypothetical protein TruAng_007715 [Truncatella angustata]|nr:hypothetical protein TruAng_007715 [Truncatella angustata]
MHRPRANECDTCERFFATQKSLYQHMDAHNNWYCNCHICGDGFSIEVERDQHEINECLYCGECHKRFMNENSMRMHRNSCAHVGANMTCPFCKASYATATGLCHHLESGNCPRAPSLNRDSIYNTVRSKNPCGIISKNMLEWPQLYSIRGKQPLVEWGWL